MSSIPPHIAISYQPKSVYEPIKRITPAVNQFIPDPVMASQTPLPPKPQPEPDGLTDEELLRTYGKAKRDHCYEGDLDDWPKKAELAATVAGLRAAIAADRARRPAPQSPTLCEFAATAEYALLELRSLVTELCDAEKWIAAERLERAADVLEASANSAPANSPQPPAAGGVADLSQLSDGYHTLAELYEHRHALMLAFMRAAPDLCWFSRHHSDGELCFGGGEWFIVGAELPDIGMVTYHLPMRLWGPAELTGAAELERGRLWDGHTANDVVQRLTEWATRPCKTQPEPQPPIDGEVAELVEWLGNPIIVGGALAASDSASRWLTRTAELLQRQHPQPVPVSERMPEPSVKVLAHYFNALGKGRTICAIWVPAKSRSDEGDLDADDFLEYDEENDKYHWPEGWYEAIENWEELGWAKVYEGEIAYWQPLPQWPANALPTPGAPNV